MESSNSSNSSFRLPNLGIEKLGLDKDLDGKDGIEVDGLRGGLDGVLVGRLGIEVDGLRGGLVGVVSAQKAHEGSDTSLIFYCL